MCDFVPIGTCVRFNDIPDVWCVEDCRPSQDGKSRFLQAINLSGTVAEYEVSSSLKLTELPSPVKREDFFIPQTVCPLCGADVRNAPSRFVVQQLFWKFNVVECPKCHLVFKEEFSTPDFLKYIYGQDYVHYAVDDNEPDGSLLESRVRRMGSPCGRHLDYGCGAGSFVHSARHFGWDSYGADPFLPDVTVRGVPKECFFRFDAALPDANLLTKIGRFNCITMWAVLEHLTTPDITLQNIVSLLEPGGLLIFNAPNPESIVARRDGSRWKLALLLEHLLFWSPACVTQMATRYGLKIRRISICGSPFPFGRENPSQTAQGLRRLPIEYLDLPSVPIATTTGHYVRSNFNAKKISLSQRISRYLRHILGNNMSSSRADTLRKIIKATRIGDHIEVVLQKE